MNFSPYIATLKKLTRAQLAAEVTARLIAFNRAEERREAFSAVEVCRRRHVLSVREMAKRGEQP